MTIAPEVLGDENDSDKRSGFHLVSMRDGMPFVAFEKNKLSGSG
jgi:hypothetical protein